MKVIEAIAPNGRLRRIRVPDDGRLPKGYRLPSQPAKPAKKGPLSTEDVKA